MSWIRGKGHMMVLMIFLYLVFIQLRPGEQKFIYFPILPLTLGNIKVTVEGHTAVMRSTDTKVIKVVVSREPFH
jgi:hypothetical protein